jgi:Dyp-type peroxidase family
MKYAATSYFTASKHNDAEKQMVDGKRRQGGIAFPAPRKQGYVLIIRLNVNASSDQKIAKDGLKRLCTLFEAIDDGRLEMEDNSSDEDDINFYPLSKFNFTGTIGFGKTFFKKLNLINKCPKKLYDMPDASELGDTSPYGLSQTDMILQLASNDYSVNRMVLQNDNYFMFHKNHSEREEQYLHDYESGPLDIIEGIKGWAEITDVHNGFHRADGKNLMGFYDGISNPYRLFNNDIWISRDEADQEHAGGTYMVFQKIEHNLNEWRKLSTLEQEKWVGRSKATGLLLGTLSNSEEKRLISELHSNNSSKRKQAKLRLSELVQEQRNPRKNFFNPFDVRYRNVYKNCPIYSHARKANPRRTNAIKQNFIFRRGFLYMEDEFLGYPKSGILFISFQNDIKAFEEIKRNLSERVNRSYKTEQSARIDNYSHQKQLVKITFDTLTLGGGYYFIPPIPDKKISCIGQNFF